MQEIRRAIGPRAFCILMCLWKADTMNERTFFEALEERILLSG
ncbi:MAG: LEPR-XLL domain-containing protein, partial [Phycisphaerales bacterium]|nr:LEPR-XLL domain-containing protein [Phycisphaerales bacterium]